MYILKYRKDIWPNYVAPFPDELFTSWFIRLCASHNVKPLSFINNFFEKHTSLFNRDIDLSAPQSLKNILVLRTPMNMNQVDNLFLTSYEGYAFEKTKPKTYTANIIPLGIIHRKRKRFGLLYCSSCLAKKGYFKKEWRLLSSIICYECNQYLCDECPQCHAGIAFHRINIGKQINSAIYFCYSCNFDLRNTPIKKVSILDHLKYQKYINKTITNGYNDISNYSFDYIYTLLNFSKKIVSNRLKTKFRDSFSEYYGEEFLRTNSQFCLLRLEERIKILVYMNMMLMNWPSSFQNIKKIRNFNNAELYSNMDKAPYWVTYQLKFC